MSNIYCVKCKKKTGSSNTNVVQTKNNRYRLTGQCTSCGTMKSQFISQQHANGLLGNLLGFPGGKIPGLSNIPVLGNLLF